jgi:hypothetical protein
MIDPMFMVRGAALLAIAMLAALPAPRASAQSLMGFKMPSGNIYCIIEPPYEGNPASDLRCDIQQMSSKPPPAPKDCPLSWGDAFAVAQDGNAGTRICHGDTTRDESLMTLAYGTQWNEGGYLCKSATSGLTCTNAAGHGFMLSKATQKLF